VFQEMHAVVALHSGFGACETEISAAKKVARYNRRSNLPTGLRVNTRSGHDAAQSQKAKGEHEAHENGFR
jgi:hypothetical protein